MKKDDESEIGVDEECECDAWIDAEIVRLKQAGFDDQFIAMHVEACGRGDPEALAMLSRSNPIDGIAFPPDFAFSTEEVRERSRLALADIVLPELAEWRELTNPRCERLWLAAQPGITKGEPAAISVGLRILIFQGQMLGFEGSEPMPENTATSDSTPTREMLDRLTAKELADFEYLCRKLYGTLDDGEPAQSDAGTASSPTTTAAGTKKPGATAKVS